MAKQWFSYINPSTTLSAQITPANYILVGQYVAFCSLANRTCLLYSFYSSGSAIRPSFNHGGAPGISANLQSYIASFTTGGGPVVAQPVVGKKYLYVMGS